MLRHPPRSTRTDTLCPTRRSSDLQDRCIHREPQVVIIGLPMSMRGRRKWHPPRNGIEARLFNGGRRSYMPTIIRQCSDTVPSRSEEHTSELQSLMRLSYAVFCLKKKTNLLSPHTCKLSNI